MTSRYPATKSHRHNAQQHNPRAEDAQKPLVHDGPRLNENQGGSCAYLSWYRQPRQPIRSRAFRESEYTYNLGGGALRRSTLRRKINREEYAEAPEQFMRWVWVGGRKFKGLIRRRTAAAGLYISVS